MSKRNWWTAAEVRERVLRLRQDGWCGSEADLDDLEMLLDVAESWAASTNDVCVKCGGSGKRRDGTPCRYCSWLLLNRPEVEPWIKPAPLPPPQTIKPVRKLTDLKWEERPKMPAPEGVFNAMVEDFLRDPAVSTASTGSTYLVRRDAFGSDELLHCEILRTAKLETEE